MKTFHTPDLYDNPEILVWWQQQCYKREEANKQEVKAFCISLIPDFIREHGDLSLGGTSLRRPLNPAEPA